MEPVISRGSTRLLNLMEPIVIFLFMKMFRISVREATPEADLYNYNFKDKWEKSVEEGGLPKKYDKYDMNGYRKDHRIKNIKFTSKFDPNASDESAFGKDILRMGFVEWFYLFIDAKYDNVDKDWIDMKSNNYFSNEENSAENKEESGNRRQKAEDKSKTVEGGNTKAWFVEF